MSYYECLLVYYSISFANVNYLYYSFSTWGRTRTCIKQINSLWHYLYATQVFLLIPFLLQAKGIGPSSSDWKSEVIPLYDTCLRLSTYTKLVRHFVSQFFGTSAQEMIFTKVERRRDLI